MHHVILLILIAFSLQANACPPKNHIVPDEQKKKTKNLPYYPIITTHMEVSYAPGWPCGEEFTPMPRERAHPDTPERMPSLAKPLLKDHSEHFCVSAQGKLISQNTDDASHAIAMRINAWIPENKHLLHQQYPRCHFEIAAIF